MTLNKAMEMVLRTQFKKQVKEAHKIVEEAGYTINKIQGGYQITNPKTGRFIYIRQDGYRKSIIHGYYNSQQRRIRSEADYQKFDYTGCLNKPINKDYYEQILNEEHTAYHKSEAMQKLKSAKWSLKYEEDRIARIQKDIEKLQQDLIRAAMAKARAIDKLNEVKKDLGLKR